MALISKLFNSAQNGKISLGRYSNYFRTAVQKIALDKAYEGFLNDNFLQAYKELMDFLLNVEDQNLEYSFEKDILHFTIYQGSRKIIGKATQDGIQAYSIIAKGKSYQEGLLEHLLTKNFELKHTKYSLNNDGELCITYESGSVGNTPFLVLEALKELAIHADKQDDLIVAYYDQLTPLISGHIKVLPQEEVKAKVNYFYEKLNQTLGYLNKHKDFLDQYPSARIYAIFDFVYTLDFLLHPEGVLMETFETMHRLLHERKTDNALELSYLFLDFLEEMAEIPKSNLEKEFYEVIFTFNRTPSISLRSIKGVIENELVNMLWYEKNGYPELALSITNYIVGYILFNHTVPLSARSLFIIYLRVVQPDFFKSLNDDLKLIDENGKIHKRKVKKAFNAVQDLPDWKQIGVKKINFSDIDTSSKTRFAYTFLLSLFESTLRHD